jgi:hypothetical protein
VGEGTRPIRFNQGAVSEITWADSGLG